MLSKKTGSPGGPAVGGGSPGGGAGGGSSGLPPSAKKSGIVIWSFKTNRQQQQKLYWDISYIPWSLPI